MTADNNMPTEIICGYKDNISSASNRLTDKQTPIVKIVRAKVRSLSGGATYIALGDEKEQPYRLTAVGSEHDIDWINDLSKVIVSTDTGTGCLEWLGG